MKEITKEINDKAVSKLYTVLEFQLEGSHKMKRKLHNELSIEFYGNLLGYWPQLSTLQMVIDLQLAHSQTE
jgi:hypothetical protein